MSHGDWSVDDEVEGDGQQDGEFAVLPPGVYDCQVVRADWATNDKTKSHYLKLYVKVKHEGTTYHVFPDIYHTQKDGSPIGVGRKHINAIAKACRALTAERKPDAPAMVGNTVRLKFKHETYQNVTRPKLEAVVPEAPRGDPGGDNPPF